MLPCGHISRLERISQAVVVSLKYDVVVFPEQIALLSADFLLFFIKVCRVELVAKGSAHSDNRFCLKWYKFSTVGNVCAHGARRVHEGGSVVELQPVDGIVVSLLTPFSSVIKFNALINALLSILFTSLF